MRTTSLPATSTLIWLSGMSRAAESSRYKVTLRNPIGTDTMVRVRISAWIRRARFSPPLRMPMRTRSWSAPLGSMIWKARRSIVRCKAAAESTTRFSLRVVVLAMVTSGSSPFPVGATRVIGTEARGRSVLEPDLRFLAVVATCLHGPTSSERVQALRAQRQQRATFLETGAFFVHDRSRRFFDKSFGRELAFQRSDLATGLLHFRAQRGAFPFDERSIDRQQHFHAAEPARQRVGRAPVAVAQGVHLRRARQFLDDGPLTLEQLEQGWFGPCDGDRPLVMARQLRHGAERPHGLDEFHYLGHRGTRFLIHASALRSRPARGADALAFVREVLPELLAHERHDGMQQLQQRRENAVEDRRARWALVLGELDVDVTKLVPGERVDGLRPFGEVVARDRRIDPYDRLSERVHDPAIG